MTIDFQSDIPAPKPRRSWKRRLVIAIPFMGVAVGIWWVMWGAAADIPDHAVSVKRGPDGRFEQSSDSGIGAKAHLSTLKSNKSATTASSYSSRGGSMLRAQSALVSVGSQNPLAERVAHELFLELQKSSRFESLHYLPAGETLPEGELLPELFITVDLKSLDESGVIPYRELETDLVVQMSDRYQRSSHSYQDTFTPPGIQFRWQSEIDYSAREIGIETASARYQAVGRDLAGGIAKDIEDFLDKRTKEYGTAGQTPSEFLPKFVPAPEFAFLDTIGAERILSGPAFMRPNVTIWRIPASSGEERIAADVARGLREAGWDVPEETGTSDDGYLRVEQDDVRVVEVFHERDGLMSGPADQEPRAWYCVYEQRMTLDESLAGLRAILKRDVPEATLVQFSSWWLRERELVEEYFREHPPMLEASLIHLARERIRQEKPDEARRMLLRADAIGRIGNQSSDTSDEIKKLAKELGLEEFPKLPDLTALQQGDLVDLRESFSETVRVRLGETAIMLLSSSDEEQRYLCLTPQPSQGSASKLSFRVQEIQLEEGGSGWSDSVREIGTQPNWLQVQGRNEESRLRVYPRRLPETGEVELRFEAVELEQAGA